MTGAAFVEAQAAAREALTTARAHVDSRVSHETSDTDRQILVLINVLMKLSADEELTLPYRVLEGFTTLYGVAALLALLAGELR